MRWHANVYRVAALLAALGLGAAVAAPQTPAPADADTHAFFVAPGTRDAMLNGQPLLPGTAVLEGETITTGAGGVVVLTPTHGPGGAILLSGNASVTVKTGQAAPGASDQLQINQGDARISGDITVSTPQGQIFRPAGGGASFVVNVGNQQSTMGVLTGNVNTYNPGVSTAPNTTVPAGNAIQVSTRNGRYQYRNVGFNEVHQPAANDTVPQTTAASQSQ